MSCRSPIPNPDLVGVFRRLIWVNLALKEKTLAQLGEHWFVLGNLSTNDGEIADRGVYGSFQRKRGKKICAAGSYL